MQKAKRTFLHDAVDFVTLGSHSLQRDDFSDCFKPLSPYDLRRGSVPYIFSFFVRYFIIFPIRMTIFTIGMFLIGFLFLYGRYFRNYGVIQDSFIIFNKFTMLVLNCHVTHKGKKKLRNEPHIYVSNHTTFVDYLILSSYKFSHACISEGHSGLFGFIITHILSKNGSIGFKRSDKQDRAQILVKVKEHIHEKKAPMLIFPEGTCVNNESIVLFQKGAFELGTLICPVGIKYKKDMTDPYWNRREHGFTLHLFYLFTRWGIDVEVHWMNPMHKKTTEDPITFSHRVKQAIARKLKLRNTIWNGYFKSSPVLNDREILKNCFISVYLKMKENKLGEEKRKDINEGRYYLLDENIDNTEKDDKVYFDQLSYRKFINECCKEYLRTKALTPQML
ncbi:uncharacterized protein VICG_01554 [Vittaforma corneae ATCC 50505]|uniref:Phospholipid/glycerol acyltransferase domain-containing protein n=1 Tax=Vittaforma corneae (strain ATCC 50505) TaxID=993615 RepID=L2GLC7_VITCO|nr:uncharacterized protein VICG_01554 [Vittaforma corneae ATCC 50505]ELA41449.1 hypothetical protein VICG_01554 [Vittaforma corneae ATCC 50505]